MSSEEDSDALDSFFKDQKRKVEKKYIYVSDEARSDTLDEFIVSDNEPSTDESDSGESDCNNKTRKFKNLTNVFCESDLNESNDLFEVEKSGKKQNRAKPLVNKSKLVVQTKKYRNLQPVSSDECDEESSEELGSEDSDDLNSIAKLKDCKLKNLSNLFSESESDSNSSINSDKIVEGKSNKLDDKKTVSNKTETLVHATNILEVRSIDTINSGKTKLRNNPFKRRNDKINKPLQSTSVSEYCPTKLLKNVSNLQTSHEELFSDDEECNSWSSNDTATDYSDFKENHPEIVKPTPAIKSKVNFQKHIPINTSVSTKVDFISSLMDAVNDDRRDLEALKFRNNFKSQKHQLSLKIFNIYNEKVFDNKLPVDTQINWNVRLLKTAGRCCYKRNPTTKDRYIVIQLSSKVLTDAERLVRTMVHELCHGATWIINGVHDHHGKIWKSWTVKCYIAFPNVPQSSRCHNYVINSKYEYWCLACDKCLVKRHCKSIDINKKVCKGCKGKLALYINKANGEKKLVTNEERKLTGFPAFVQQNYKVYRTPGSTHKDAMKLLSVHYKMSKTDISSLMTSMKLN